MSRSAPQDWSESGQIRMIREVMEKVLSCLVWGERARMGHPAQTWGEKGTAELEGREGGVVIEKELLAWGCVIWRVFEVQVLWGYGATDMDFSDILLSSGERNGN